MVRAEPGSAGTLPALEVLRRHGEHTSAFLSLNDETQHFAAAGIDGYVAYRPAGRRHVIQLCGPFCAPGDRARLLREFRSWAAGRGAKVTAVQLTRDEAPAYAEQGFAVNQLGSSYSIDLEGFQLRGTAFMKLRNKLKRARRLGVTVEELAPGQPTSPDTARELAEVDAAWLRGKGRLAKELTFMVGERAGRGAPYRRVLVARHEGRITCYVTYSPCFGSRPGWLYDLTRRRPDSPPGAVELVFATMVERLRDEGCRWLHLGLTPFAALSREHELPEASSGVVERFASFMAEHGSAIYPSRAQEKFKLKWRPQVIEPEYVAFEGRPSVAAVYHLMRVTRAI
jgi:lysylphosphatidylglycerol synthetase-like protein (DUF2156 family)